MTSNAWRFTVQSANVELRIDRVEDGNGNDIPQISSTPYRQVVVHGKGTPSTNVDLFEGPRRWVLHAAMPPASGDV
ncbi:hypothetical protein THH46_08180 [Pseudomonas sp. NA13]